MFILGNILIGVTIAAVGVCGNRETIRFMASFITLFIVLYLKLSILFFAEALIILVFSIIAARISYNLEKNNELKNHLKKIITIIIYMSTFALIINIDKVKCFSCKFEKFFIFTGILFIILVATTILDELVEKRY